MRPAERKKRDVERIVGKGREEAREGECVGSWRSERGRETQSERVRVRKRRREGRRDR